MAELRKAVDNLYVRNALRVLGATVALAGGMMEAPAASADSVTGGTSLVQPGNVSGGAGLPAPSRESSSVSAETKMARSDIQSIAKMMYLGKYACHTNTYSRKIYPEGGASVLTGCITKPNLYGSSHGLVEFDVVSNNQSNNTAYRKPWKHAFEVEVTEGIDLGHGEYLPETTDIITLNNLGATAATQTTRYNTNKYLTNTASIIPRHGEADLTPSDLTSETRQMSFMLGNQSMTQDLPLAFSVPAGSAKFPI